MRKDYAANPRTIMILLLTTALFACDARRAVPTGDGTANGLDGNAPDLDGNAQDFNGCTFVKKKQCWACGGCKQETYPSIGCKAKNQCGQFCSPCLPSGYTWCLGDIRCNNWPAPRGSLEDCLTDTPGWYSCYFCEGPHLSPDYAKGADGKCLMFLTSCFPVGYQLCDMMDGGVD